MKICDGCKKRAVETGPLGPVSLALTRQGTTTKAYVIEDFCVPCFDKFVIKFDDFARGLPISIPVQSGGERPTPVPVVPPVP